MPRVAGKATRTSSRQAARQTARQGGRVRTGLRNLRNRLSGRRNAAGGDTTKPVGGRTATKDPIDIATGEVFLHQVDLELPGTPALVLERTHVSSFRAGRWFGPGWSSTLDQRLEIDNLGVCLVTTEGRILTYPIGMYGQPVMPLKGERWPLTIKDGDYTVHQPQEGLTLHFAAQPNAGIPGEPVAVRPLKAITDRNGNRIDLDYDGQGTLERVRHSGGYVIDIDTDGGLITALRSGDIVLKSFDYDEEGDLVAVAGPSGVPTRFDYDDAGRMTRWTDTNGHWYAYTYDDQGRAIRGTGVDGHLNASLTYDPAGRWTVLTDSLGHRTTYRFNEHGQVVAETDPLGHTTTFEWDERDQLTSCTDPLGRTVRYTYDEAGNRTRVQYPNGVQIQMLFNELNRVTHITGPDGATWHNTYDQVGNLVAVVDPLGGTTRYTYDERGALSSITDALGGTTRLENDRAGLPVRLIDRLGAVTDIQRDAFGRVISVTDPVGGTTRFGWSLDNLLTTEILPSGATEKWEYDTEGNPIARIDAMGQITRTIYGPFDTPVEQIAPDGTRLRFDHDTELRLRQVTNQRGLTWRYRHDPVGHIVEETDFNGRTLRYALDPAGQIVRRVNGAGEVTEYARDVFGRVIEQRSGDRVTHFAYDVNGNLIRAVGPEADLEFRYDPLGRVLTETCNGRTLASTYDALGRRIHRRTPSGVEAAWSYDPAGRPVSLSTAGQTLRFSHDAVGRETRRHIGSGAILDQQYDPDHRLISQALWGAPTSTAPSAPGATTAVSADPRLLQHRTYVWRPDMHVTAIGDRLNGDRTFAIDDRGRVTAVHAQGWSERYAYDSTGNVVHTAVEGRFQQGDPLSLTAGDRAYSGMLVSRAGRTVFEHDSQGRVVKRRQRTQSGQAREWTHVWDSDDRLVAVTTPDGRYWRYRYDALGRRIGKQRLGPGGAILEEVTFTWDGPLLVEEVHTSAQGGSAARITTWDYRPGEFTPLTQIQRVDPHGKSQQWFDQQFYAIITDLVGSPAEMVDTAGNLVWSLRISLWGVDRSARADRVHCPLRFPGQYFDPESQLHYNFHRYYDPLTGHYTTTDPIGLEGGLNPHAYVTDPNVWIDPLGLKGAGRTTVYRVEGPGNERVRIHPDGGVLIRDAKKPIFLNFGVDSRAKEFLAKRLAQGFDQTTIKRFDVNDEFLDWLRKNAVPESLAKQFPDRPLVVDTTKAVDQYMLREQHIKKMFEHIIKGSGGTGLPGGGI